MLNNQCSTKLSLKCVGEAVFLGSSATGHRLLGLCWQSEIYLESERFTLCRSYLVTIWIKRPKKGIFEHKILVIWWQKCFKTIILGIMGAQMVIDGQAKVTKFGPMRIKKSRSNHSLSYVRGTWVGLTTRNSKSKFYLITWTIIERYEGNDQYSGSLLTNIGNSTHNPFIEIHELIPNKIASRSTRNNLKGNIGNFEKTYINKKLQLKRRKMLNPNSEVGTIVNLLKSLEFSILKTF